MYHVIKINYHEVNFLVFLTEVLNRTKLRNIFMLHLYISYFIFFNENKSC